MGLQGSLQYQVLPYSHMPVPSFFLALFFVLAVCALLGYSLYQDSRTRGKRPGSSSRVTGSAFSEISGSAFILAMLWLLTVFFTFAISALLKQPILFEKVFTLLGLSCFPAIFFWFLFPLRNRNWWTYRFWQVCAISLLVWSAVLSWRSLYFGAHLVWWRATIDLLPMIVWLMMVGLAAELLSISGTFRAAYRWQRHEGKYVTVYVPPGKSIEEMQELVTRCDWTLRAVTRQLEVEPLTFKPEVFLFPDKEMHNALLGKGGKDGFAYAHDDCITLVYDPWSRIGGVVAHELTHVMRHQRISASLNCLLDEGLARYVQTQVAPRSARLPEITMPVSLRTLAHYVIFFDWQYATSEETEYSASDKYAHAHAFADFLIGRNGMPHFKKLCQEASNTKIVDPGEGLAIAIRDVYGASLREIEAEWRTKWDAHEASKKQNWWNKCTEKAREATWIAVDEAKALGLKEIATEHMLLALLRDEESIACRLLKMAGIDVSDLRVAILRDAQRGLSLGYEAKSMHPTAQRAIELSFEEAHALDKFYIGMEHMLLGVLREPDGLAGKILIAKGVEAANLRQFLAQIRQE